MAEITIGAPAIDRASAGAGTYTWVEQSNPANDSGTITSVEVWMFTEASAAEVATFSEGASNVLSTRDYEALGVVASGSKQTFSGLDMDVQTGDYLGFYAGGVGNIDRTDSGETGLWYYASADKIPCTDETFSSAAGYMISLYGTGATAVAAVGFGCVV